MMHTADLGTQGKGEQESRDQDERGPILLQEEARRQVEREPPLGW